MSNISVRVVICTQAAWLEDIYKKLSNECISFSFLACGSQLSVSYLDILSICISFYQDLGQNSSWKSSSSCKVIKIDYVQNLKTMCCVTW